MRMSGEPSCARVEQSTYSTIEWITDCGWTRMPMRSSPTGNRWCASISSRPLFIIVAESTLIFAPIDQLGRSEEHTSELQSLMRNSYAVLCLKKKNKTNNTTTDMNHT